ncbi:hypothetical protein Q428_03040 [Fervidicella metallireducens AeB]|uniref:Rqc2 homolog RqcH n=1 Tax=Fervidicella metallireducens AeB TaxID=1403537 RepID=A0A017RXY0_9CLOT|nr:NFACT RNA binding domain-containing protein [Fervidicella metallireducens]EYE89264.1 hypothetical protein Q428_03040 [Fervidicella metallireducens AeB]
MPFDGIFTNSVVNELSCFADYKIEKIHQPSNDEIILLVRKDKQSKKILLSANTAFPRVHVTEEAKENPLTPPTFCMILRKHITNGKIVNVDQINFDRIVEFKIEGKDELGFSIFYFLIIEIMGKHSNIILLNQDRNIIDSIKHINFLINRYREILPGKLYILPPNNKLNPTTISKEDLNKIIITSTGKISNVFSNNFTGISKLMAEQICMEFSDKNIADLDNLHIEKIISNFFYYMIKIKSGDYKYILFYEGSIKKDFYIFPLNIYNNFSTKTFQSSGNLLDTFYHEKNLKDTLKQKYTDLFKLVTNLIERNSKKTQIYISKINECKNFEQWKIYGDLIMANQYIIKDDMECIDLDNFYDENYSKITVPLEKGLTPLQNAQKYYKKYTKDKTAINVVKEQLEGAREEKEYLDSILYNLENASDIDTIEEIKSELSELGYIKRKKNTTKAKKSSPYHYLSSDGYDIFVGKNNNQNDYLTTKLANNNDIWLHTKNIPGSHVIIKSKNNNVSDNALLEGALLAAYYSKGRDSSNVPVDYTEKKNVKKPSGSKPGMVIYYTNKTIYITPNEEKIKKLTLISK